MNRPGKIICVGRNYVDHAKELGNEMPQEPLLFLKPSSSMIGDGEAIVLPSVSEEVHFEGEIGIVIGERLSRASETDAVRGIRGIVAANDVSARDLQKKDGQWARAKGCDTFCPVGPEGPVPSDLALLEVVTRVNGQERQRGTAAQMAFPIPMILSYISQAITLEPGDIVLTGTPAGVGKLQAGDEVEVEIVVAGNAQEQGTRLVSHIRNPVQDQR